MLICIVVWQNPTQHCKAIILQLKKEQPKIKVKDIALGQGHKKKVKGDSGTNSLKQKLTFFPNLHQERSYCLISHTHTHRHTDTHTHF